MKKNITLLLCLFFLGLAASAQTNVDPPGVVDETQIWSDNDDEIKMVWYIPTEFWEISAREDPEMSEDDIEMLTDALGKSTLIAVIEGEIGAFGNVSYTDERSIRKNIQLVATNGKVYRPVDEEDLDPTTNMMLGLMSPMLANMLGQMGEHMYFIAFPAEDERGNRLVDPTNEGEFQVRLSGDEFTFVLPLGSLKPLKKCPEDGRELSGGWNFCPWHGTELVPAE